MQWDQIFSSKSRWLLLIILCVIVFDQITKYIAIHYIPDAVVLNPDGTWGVLPAWVGIVSLIGLSFFAWKQSNMTKTIGLILGAGISNTIDRVLHGGVIDFIHIGSFPIFNVADVLITVGGGLLIYYELRYNILKHKNKKTDQGLE